MPVLKIDIGGMAKVDRFDRCRTCHYSIDTVGKGTDPGFPLGKDPKEDGGYPHPYASHPRLDLYLTSASPHPLPKFRVNGPLANMPAFAEAYGCKTSDKMVTAGAERCDIW